MPKYSVKQINHAWHLAKDHGKNIDQIADLMDCTRLDARDLVEAAKRMYDRPIDRYLNKPEPVKKMIREKAVYSNHSPMGIAS